MKEQLRKDNFYEAINAEWHKNAVIPDDQPAMSAFLELHLGIEKTLMELAKKWQEDSSGLNANLLKFLKVLKKANDFNLREELGVEPIKKVIEGVDKITNLADLQSQFKELSLEGINLPFNFMVMQDFINSDNQVLYFHAARLILPDTSYYQNEQTKTQLLALWENTTTAVLKLYGLGDEEIKELLADTIKFDSLLVPVTKSSVEQADYVKMYNPLTKKELLEKVKNIDLIEIAETLVSNEVLKLIATNIDVIEQFDNIFKEENLKIIKSWMKVFNYLKFASEFTENLRVAGGAFTRALSGTKAAQNKEKAAFYKAYNYFNQVVGLYYGENYFGPEAKKEVETMVKEMIMVYQARIKTNDWLKEETKIKAIKKLSTLSVLVGYPEELPKYYDDIVIKDEDTLLDIRLKITKLMTLDNLSKYQKTPNKKLWSMPASMVNAYYNPLNNQIVFPAAILQEPYYSRKQSISANFGGIGAVIAHEISHAFDNNGAKFDETGSLNNWWTQEDLAAFEEKKQMMIKFFDGLETGYGKCNGVLTVSENIADSGGLRAALEASKTHKDHDFEEFFSNWARVWRQKAHSEYQKLLLTIDVHGPAILRANRQLANLKEFQEYYQLQKSDQMFLDEADMITIW
ncbi:MAG: M13 family metallopeptidase [Acholeplasmataceae bacterium]|nr:M13 family metallopeptidase [Acholeplasmataceae bacterium]